MKHNLHAYLNLPASALKLPKRITNLLIGRMSFWLGGLLAGMSLFIEAKHRRPELAMYVLPKGLESVWKMARGKGLVISPAKYGECVVCLRITVWGIDLHVSSQLCAAGMGMVMVSACIVAYLEQPLTRKYQYQNAYQVSARICYIVVTLFK
jgi:hypothetical protein